MNVAELAADLRNRPQDAELIIVDPETAPGHVLMIDSVVKEDKKTTVVLIARSTRPTSFPGEMPPSSKPHRVVISKSNDGKYQATVDGRPLMSNCETENDAKIFVRGYVLGCETGNG
jgi:hypothetical protein